MRGDGSPLRSVSAEPVPRLHPNVLGLPRWGEEGKRPETGSAVGAVGEAAVGRRGIGGGALEDLLQRPGAADDVHPPRGVNVASGNTWAASTGFVSAWVKAS